MRRRTLLLTLFAFLFVTAPAAAQTAQKFSLQGSFLHASLGGDDYDYGGFAETGPGTGFEVQVRYNPGALSFGLGYQYTDHPVTVNMEGYEEDQIDDTYAGVFVEPRYVFFIGSDRFAPYASARLMALINTFSWYDAWNDQYYEEEYDAWGYTLGGGVLVRLMSRVNMDAGFTAGNVNVTLDADQNESTSGFSTVFRVGVAAGLF